MSLIVDNRRFFCTTSDVAFGPLFDSDEDGEKFRIWMYQNLGDPRIFHVNFLSDIYVAWRVHLKNQMPTGT